MSTGSAADRLKAWGDTRDGEAVVQIGWDVLNDAIDEIVSESTAAENERCLEALREVRSLIPHDQAAALGAIGDAMSRIEVGP